MAKRRYSMTVAISEKRCHCSDECWISKTYLLRVDWSSFSSCLSLEGRLWPMRFPSPLAGWQLCLCRPCGPRTGCTGARWDRYGGNTHQAVPSQPPTGVYFLQLNPFLEVTGIFMSGIELADHQNPCVGPEVCGDSVFETQTWKVNFIRNVASGLQVLAILGVFCHAERW